MVLATTASSSVEIAGLLGGLLGGAAAVWLARIVPARMDLEQRERPVAWWVLALAFGGLYGWLLTELVTKWAYLPAYLVFGAATLALALIDLDHRLIPNRLLFPSIGVALTLLTVGALIDGSGLRLLRGVSGGVVYFGFLLAVAFLSRSGFGMGDVKLALLLGLFLTFVGWDVLLVGMVLAILLGGVASVLLLVFSERSRKAKFAYGPYLVVGAWMGVIWGQSIADWYLRVGS